MRKILARTAIVAGLVAGMGAFAAPAATADVILVFEQGPGDSTSAQVKDSENVDQKANDKSVTTGDLTWWIKDVKDSPITTEVEGAEQDQGEQA